MWVAIHAYVIYMHSWCRWHPDRFEAKFGDRMECSQREEIMDCVKEAFQMCNAARR